jgi:tRNA pseudouridine38-40 synthase
MWHARRACALVTTLVARHARADTRSRAGTRRQLPPLSAYKLRGGLNHFLCLSGEAARVVAAARVCPSRCHARFSALARTYHYRLHAARAPPALHAARRVWHVPTPLDVPAMRAAAAHLLGRHDFSAWRAPGCGASSPLRTLTRLDVHAAPGWAQHPAPPPWLPRDAWSSSNHDGDAAAAASCAGVVITAVAPSFLYHQVRMLVGTLAAVGAGRLRADDVASLREGRDATRCPPMAPPHGLSLADVAYDQAALALPEDAQREEEGGRVGT